MTNLKTRTESTPDGLFRKLTILTVITVYLLIAAGGIVRSTGSGMGCPDWPKCFGSWVPPTEAYQLPSNYKEIYGAKLKGNVEFNVVKTWTEYLNRLLGVFTGLLIFATLLASIRYLRSSKSSLFYASLAAFILVGFQGWLGSKVVSTELHPVMVTIHMIVAIVIVFILIYLLFRSHPGALVPVQQKGYTNLNKILKLAIVLSFCQVILGTQVREAIDSVIAELGYESRGQWIDALGLSFYIHRSFSIIVLIVNGLLVYRLLDGQKLRIPILLSQGIMLVVLLEILTGVIMAYLAVPAFAQPIHLTLAIVLLGIQYALWLGVSTGIEPSTRQLTSLLYKSE
jgi:cytochrome c oxidase assembly protein subunit 15